MSSKSKRRALVSCDERDVSLKHLPAVSSKVNKMFDCIVWHPGYTPMMILDGQVLPMDIIADSILDGPFIKEPIIGGAVYIQFTENQHVNINLSRLSTESEESPRGEIIYFKTRELSPRVMTCWNFIKWLNENLAEDPDRLIESIEIQLVEYVVAVTVKINLAQYV